MSRKNKNALGPVMGGLLLIAMGVIWILHNLHIVEFPFHHWWPLILIVIGLVHLANQRRITEPGGWILITLGVAFLLVVNDFIRWGDIWRYWPVILIIIGISIILDRAFDRPSAPTNEEDEYLGPGE
ncbi:MAG: hypothetical protein GY757_61595 [bacterium]|nr:hypothetical protein [bacterium]